MDRGHAGGLRRDLRGTPVGRPFCGQSRRRRRWLGGRRQGRKGASRGWSTHGRHALLVLDLVPKVAPPTLLRRALRSPRSKGQEGRPAVLQEGLRIRVRTGRTHAHARAEGPGAAALRAGTQRCHDCARAGTTERHGSPRRRGGAGSADGGPRGGCEGRRRRDDPLPLPFPDGERRWRSRRTGTAACLEATGAASALHREQGRVQRDGSRAQRVQPRRRRHLDAVLRVRPARDRCLHGGLGGARMVPARVQHALLRGAVHAVAGSGSRELQTLHPQRAQGARGATHQGQPGGGGGSTPGPRGSGRRGSSIAPRRGARKSRRDRRARSARG